MLEASHYEALLDDQEFRPQACPICTGDPDAEPCGEECSELFERCNRERVIKGLYMTARSAMRWAHMYATKPSDFNDRRIAALLDEVSICRKKIAALRAA